MLKIYSEKKIDTLLNIKYNTKRKHSFGEKMVTIESAKSIKDLGLIASEANKIVKLATGNSKVAGVGARKISEALGIPRRRVMRVLELNKVTSYSEGSYL